MVMILKYGVSKRQWCLFTYHFVSVVVVVLVLWHTLQWRSSKGGALLLTQYAALCWWPKDKKWVGQCLQLKQKWRRDFYFCTMAFIYQEWSVQPFSVITSHQMRWMHLTCMAVAAVARSSITLITQLQQRTATITFETKHITFRSGGKFETSHT